MRNDFDAGKSITRAIVRALNIKTFLGPEIALSPQACAISGPKKVEMFRAQKSQDVQGPFNGLPNGFARIKIITHRAV